MNEALLLHVVIFNQVRIKNQSGAVRHDKHEAESIELND